MTEFLEECFTHFPGKLIRTQYKSSVPYPPSYYDLGKNARDLFNVGYNFGLLTLNVITKTKNNIKFTTTCVEHLKQRRLFGSLEAKYELPNSLTLAEKWNTDCTVTTEISLKNKPVNGFSATFIGSICPKTSKKTGVLKTGWRNKFCCLNCEIDLKNKLSLLTTTAVIGYNGFLWGVSSRFDSHNLKLNDFNFAAGFSSKDFAFNTVFKNSSECEASIFHKFSPRVDVAIDLKYTINQKSDILLGIAGLHHLDDSMSVRWKMNNSSQLGLGLEQKIRDYIVLSWSVLFDIKNLENGKHKFGLSIQFES